MDVWTIVLTVIGGWSMVSVLVGVVIGHAISGKPLRTPLTSSDQDASVHAGAAAAVTSRHATV